MEILLSQSSSSLMCQRKFFQRPEYLAINQLNKNYKSSLHKICKFFTLSSHVMATVAWHAQLFKSSTELLQQKLLPANHFCCEKSDCNECEAWDLLGKHLGCNIMCGRFKFIVIHSVCIKWLDVKANCVWMHRVLCTWSYHMKGFAYSWMRKSKLSNL